MFCGKEGGIYGHYFECDKKIKEIKAAEDLLVGYGMKVGIRLDMMDLLRDMGMKRTLQQM